MKNVSTKFINAVADHVPIYAYAKFVLADGTQLTLTSQNDFFIDGNSFTESGDSGFPLGSAVCKTINISIDNHDDRYSQYDFYKAKITLYSEIDFEDGSTERIQEGIFTVIDSVTPGDIIEFTAYDDMYKADVSFTSKLIYPTTCMLLLQEICSTCDLSLGSASFKNSNFEIKTAPTSNTARELIGYIAQIAGGNAVISPTKTLLIKSYDLSNYNSLEIISGGKTNDSLNDIISGGKFTDDTTDSVNSGSYTDGAKYHLLHSFSEDPEIGTDDITITGIVAEARNNSETVRYLYGTEDYALKIDNPLIEGNEDAAVTLIGESIVGFTIRPFSGSFAPNPLIEFMDIVVVVDRKYNTYQSIVSGHTFNYMGTSDVENTTKSPERNKASYSNSATTLYQKAKDIADQNRSDWEKAVEELTDDLNNASGLYSTQEVQPDGSTIYYFHDKPTLEESMVVMKITSQALGISTDGGQTYPTGITVDGQAVISILQTIGVNADWIRAGTLTLGGNGNERGTLSILDGSNSQIGVWDKDGIQVLQGTFKSTSGGYTTAINSGKMHLISSDTEIGSIGANFFTDTDKKGIIYDLESTGSYIAWAAQDSPNSQYWVKLIYAREGFKGYSADTVNLGANFNLNGYTVSNGRIDNVTLGNITNLGVNGDFNVWNGNDAQVYRNVDMHWWQLKQCALTSTVRPYDGQSTYNTYTGTINVGGTNLRFVNGMLVGVG